MEKMPFTEKYRPSTLDEIYGNKEVVEVLKNIQNHGKIPHLLFYGPPGTGKTTAIRALVKNLPYSSVLELNASDERGISTVRESIKSFASTFSKTVKIVILDEVDFMSRDAQNALRRIIEDFSKNTRFCLIANYVKKIIPAIQSRCTKLRFGPIDDCESRVLEICKKERIKYTNDGITALIEGGYGDMRKIVNDIQAISLSFNVINLENVHKFNGTVSNEIFKEIYDILLDDSLAEINYKVAAMKRAHSIDSITLIGALSEIIMQSSMAKKMALLKDLSDIVLRLNMGCNEDVQINAAYASFVQYR